MRWWVEVAVGALALVGLWVTVDKALAGLVGVWGWARRDRVTPLLEDDRPEGILCAGCAGFDHCDGVEGGCDCTCGWSQDWAEPGWGRLDARPVGVVVGPLAPVEMTLTALLTALRERSPWMIGHRDAYESMGFDYPSGLMARVRELTP